MKKINYLTIVFFIMISIIAGSCGRKKDTTTSNENAKFSLTDLAPSDVKDAQTGDWIIKQEMSDAEKLNPNCYERCYSNRNLHIYFRAAFGC